MGVRRSEYARKHEKDIRIINVRDMLLRKSIFDVNIMGIIRCIVRFAIRKTDFMNLLSAEHKIFFGSSPVRKTTRDSGTTSDLDI